MKKTENLLVDCTFILETWVSSNSLAIYAMRLIQGLLKYSNYQVCVLAWQEKDAFIDELVGQKVDKILLNRRSDLTTSWRPYYRLSGMLPKKLKREIKRRNITIVINPWHQGALFFYPKTIRQYGVVHDMFLYDKVKLQRGKVSYFIWRNYQRILASKFSGLISISQMTHDELLRCENLPSMVVYNSIPFDFTIVEEPVEVVQAKRYIIDINRFQGYKNAELLIRALSLIKDEIPHYLYLKGDHEFEEERKSLEKLAVELGLEDRVIFDISCRSEGELRYLYTHADLFVSPSLKEGFGWTPIEAAILKTPVLVSDIKVFKEILCGRTPTFDPYSSEDLAKHILGLLNDSPGEQERSELADFFLNRYSLENQIKQLEEFLES